MINGVHLGILLIGIVVGIAIHMLATRPLIHKLWDVEYITVLLVGLVCGTIVERGKARQVEAEILRQTSRILNVPDFDLIEMTLASVGRRNNGDKDKQDKQDRQEPDDR